VYQVIKLCCVSIYHNMYQVRINKTIESKYDLILRDIELVAGEQGKQRIDIARLKSVIGER